MRVINTDVNNVKGRLDRYFSECIGIGRAAELMRYIPMMQLKKMQKECPFRYIRFHGIFHEEMNIVQRNDDGTLSFCFQYADMLFDTLLENNLRPIVEIGLMPETLAKDKEYVFWWKMNKSMPKEMGEWSALVEAFVKHLTYRYGEEEMKKWYFEIWNEPNHPGFFTEHKNKEAYFSLYKAAAEAIKGICSEYRVGGPATAAMEWVPDTIDYCRENNIPLDFVSSHVYGIKGDFDPEGNAVVYIPDVDMVSDIIRIYGDKARKEGYPLFITEWSSSFSGTDMIHDSYYNAPYVLRAIKRTEGYADVFSYWVYTDIFEENGPPSKPFHGGFGLFNINSIPKPTYYAYTFLHRLGDTELFSGDEDTYICKDENSVQVLLWNVKKPETKEGNRKYFARPLPAERLEDVQIVLDGLEPDKKYRVSVETIGYKSGDAYNAYLDGNFTENLTREQTQQLIEKSKPSQKAFEAVADKNGSLSVIIPQLENSVDLVVVKQAD